MILEEIRKCLVECDSELSAQAHGRPASDKQGLLVLSGMCRELSRRLSADEGVACPACEIVFEEINRRLDHLRGMKHVVSIDAHKFYDAKIAELSLLRDTLYPQLKPIEKLG